jgi:DNA-binding beta-propeller fold protein YncE
VFVAGFGRSSIGVAHVYKLVAYDAATGQPAGAAQYDNGRDDYASSIAIGPDGDRIYLTGDDLGDYLTVAFDGYSLQPLWSANYDGERADFSYSVAASPDGSRVYVTGQSGEAKVACFGDVRSTAYATVAYAAASGAERWVSRYSGLRDDPDRASQVAVSPNSASVFVTGNSDAECRSSDVATIAYRG